MVCFLSKDYAKLLAYGSELECKNPFDCIFIFDAGTELTRNNVSLNIDNDGTLSSSSAQMT